MFPLPVIVLYVLGTVFSMCASPIQGHCADSMVLVHLLRSMRVTMISRAGFFLVLLLCRNGLRMRFCHIGVYLPQSTQHPTKIAVFVIVVPSVQNVFETMFVTTCTCRMDGP